MRKARAPQVTVTVATAALLLLTGCAPEPGTVEDEVLSDSTAVATEETTDTTVDEPTDTVLSETLVDDVWNFTSVEPISSVTEIRFEITEGLLAEASKYESSRVFESITVTGLTADSAEYCALEMNFEYAHGFDMEATVEGASKLASYTSRGSSSSSDDSETETRLLAVGSVLGLETDAVKGFGEPDLENLTETGMWIADDYSSAITVTDCAASFDEAATAQRVAFVNVDGRRMNTLAEARVGVNDSGELTVLDSTVEDYMLGFNHQWKKI